MIYWVIYLGIILIYILNLIQNESYFLNAKGGILVPPRLKNI